jgi:poly(hydroxyalkanoate) depolymerase family esterase
MKSTDKMRESVQGMTHLPQDDAVTGMIPGLLSNLGQLWPLGGQMPGRYRTDINQADSEQFIDGSYTNHIGTRRYKLYIPTGHRSEALPLVVMLHGCTQDADDFAAGTRMNALAEEKQCFVLYPEQAQSANGSKCWNWFNGPDQQREGGEPAIIAGITLDVLETHGLDARRVFIAGLSSGGAMAEIMGRTYPDLYAAVGIHSGLPYASAQDLYSAAVAMKDGGSIPVSERFKSVPTIVFHGDQDTTVHPRNGDQIIAQTISNAMADSDRFVDRAAPQVTVGQGKVAQGRAYTHTVHRDGNGNTIAEHWIVHGAGHAWSGGSDHGSFTDPKGPDAGREMMRFFFSHPYFGQ